MDFEQAITSRYSVRAFKTEPVPQALLERVFTLANTTPSNCNSQPWVVHIASGEKLETLRKLIPEQMMSGVTSMDFPFDGKYHDEYRARQIGSAEAMFNALGVAREDKAGRGAAFMRNFTFFDAPHVAFLLLDEQFGIREAVDVGMYAQSLMLSLTANGLGSCPQTSLGFHADTVREVLGIESKFKLLFGISFGYPDESAPVNTCRTDRAALAENTFFH